MFDDFSFSQKEVLSKLARFCSYRDRSEGEVRLKLTSFGIASKDIPRFMDYLKSEKYLDEERFCRVYVSSKLRINHWGRQKIYAGLINNYVKTELIDSALNSLDICEYSNVLKKVLLKKLVSLESVEPIARKQKVIRYALSKGFTYNEITEQLKDIYYDNTG